MFPSSSSTPVGCAPGEIIMNNFIQRSRANQFMAYAFMDETNNARMDFLNFLKSNPTPEVMQSCIAKLESENASMANYSPATHFQMNAPPAMNTISGATASVESIAANNDQQPELANTTCTTVDPEESTVSSNGNRSTRKYVTERMKFTVRKLECIEEGCDEEFESMSELDKHLASKVHKIKLHRCPQMGCKFSDNCKAKLIEHKRKKHLRGNYECKMCNRSFNQTKTNSDRFENLLQHYKKNHYYGEYVCTICELKTNTEFQAIAHYNQCKLIRPSGNVVSSTPYPTAPSNRSMSMISLNSTTINNTFNQQQSQGTRTPEQPMLKDNSQQQSRGAEKPPKELTNIKREVTNSGTPRRGRPRKNSANRVGTIEFPINLDE